MPELSEDKTYNSGESNPNTRLDENQVKGIYKKSHDPDIDNEEIAENYGISESQVEKIKYGFFWSGVTSDVELNQKEIDEKKLKNKFWVNVDKASAFDCWLWKGSTNAEGHGNIRHNGKMKGVHRLIFTEFIQPPMDEYQVNHLCENKHCVNPNHLYLGSQKSNVIDQVIKGEMDTKVSYEQYFQIKDLLEYTDYTQSEIGDFYDVSQSTIYKINVGKVGEPYEIKKRLEGTVHEYSGK